MLTEAVRALLAALEEPALIIRRSRIMAVNAEARRVLGTIFEGTDVRLAIRHPEALEHILPGVPGTVNITGLGEFGRPWTIDIKTLLDDAILVRLIDRSVSAAAEKMRVDFVANASHELRTPLATIIGYAETLAEEAHIEGELRARFAGVIRDEGRRMLRIIEDLMGLSRIEAERFVPATGSVDVAELVTVAVRNGQRVTRDAAVTVEAFLAPDLPTVAGEPAQLLQLLDNLVTNAVRYGCTEDKCTVAVSANADAGKVRISVRDHGMGISREHLHRVTERFYRVDAGRSRDSGGTGLGLSIAKHIVERHKGTLEINSEVGRGTEVIVTLPAERTLN